MRNLLGRLNSRSADDLARIAAFWRVPLGSGGHHAQVGPLYRVLIDPRAVRGAWDRLGPEERALVRHLAIAEAEEATPTLAELAARLGVSEGEARETAVRLYRVGILAREGDDEPLPVGAAPRLFLPRELAQLFRRVQDEIEAGDLSGTPLRALLALLDDGEIEEAAATWGIRVVPGLRRRDDLTRQLLRQLGDPARVAKVVGERRRDAARLWRRVRDEPGGAPVALEMAAQDAGLAGDDPRTAQRFRAALAELESALLLWHTYRREGSRWLFVPAEIRAPGPLPDAELPLLVPVAADGAALSWLHPHALAWDLLTVLRELADEDALPWPAEGEPPRSRLRRLNQSLWRRGEEIPPIGYVVFLVALGLAEGLVHVVAGQGTVSTMAPGVRHWRDRSFAAQTERLAWWWRASPEWIEGRRLGEVEVWGADWRGLRRKLLDRLADPTIGLVPGEWYALESVAARFAAHDPDLLGSTVTVATARRAALGNGPPSDESARVAAVAEVVRVELATAFAWFGLVEVGDVPGHGRVVRIPVAPTPQPQEPSPPSSRSAGAGETRAPVEVTADGAVVLREPTPLRVWSLSAFAEPEQLGPVSRYRLSEESVRRALAAGFDLAQVTGFLTKQSGRPLPPVLAEQLAAWARAYRRVRIRRALLLTPDDPAALTGLRRVAEDAGLTVRAIDDRTLSLEGAAEGEGEPEALVSALLRAHGYAPRVETGPAVMASAASPEAAGRGRRDLA